MAKLVYSAGIIALVALLILTHNQALTAASPARTRTTLNTVKDLTLEVDRDGEKTVQIVDNQQGQVVKQTVTPGGIRQTVIRNGVVITDDIVKRPTL